MIRVLSIGSGSSGNCFYLNINGKKILIDLGLSAKAIGVGLKTVGTEPEDLDAVIITHTHSDHISGLPVFSKRIHCPIYTSELTRSKLFPYDPSVLSPGKAVTFADGIRLMAFETSHDCPGSIGIRIEYPGGAFGYATDLGCMNDRIRDILKGTDSLVLEANHDAEMLRNGPYPYVLKRRILSEGGHLSNDACAEAAAYFAENGTRNLLLAHLSRENNTPDLAMKTVRDAIHNPTVKIWVLPPNCDGEKILYDRTDGQKSTSISSDRGNP